MHPGRESTTQSAQASPAFAWFLALLDAIGSGPIGGTKIRQCPAHEDSSPSLSCSQGDDGRVLLHCHAGCSFREIMRTLALHPDYLRRPPPIAAATYVTLFIRHPGFPKVSSSRPPSHQIG